MPPNWRGHGADADRSSFNPASLAVHFAGSPHTGIPILMSRVSPLRIPRTSMAYGGISRAETGVPPSPGAAGALSTPRESLESSTPGTPNSPHTPGGRRRLAAENHKTPRSVYAARFVARSLIP